MFFGITLTPSTPYTLSSSTPKIIRITNISLSNPQSQNKAYMILEHKGTKYTLCSLQKGICEQIKCELMYEIKSSKDKFVFSLAGADKTQQVHLIGHVEADEELGYVDADEEVMNKDIDINELEVNENEKVNEEAENDNDEDEEDVLSDNGCNQELEKLLNKKTKEAPQDTKPIQLNNTIKGTQSFERVPQNKPKELTNNNKQEHNEKKKQFNQTKDKKGKPLFNKQKK
jgi:hypothetical protein